MIFGDLEQAEVIKIHLTSYKVTLQVYEGFFENPLPRLLKRIKIRLRDLDFDYFDYRKARQNQLLYFKSRVMPNDHPALPEQLSFDDQVRKLVGLKAEGYGPSERVFLRNLQEAGLKIVGFKIEKRK